jgi:hypothetical protein
LFLYAEKEPIKFERAALRWLAWDVTEGKMVSLCRNAHRAVGVSRAAGGQTQGCGQMLTGLVRR